MRSLRSPGEQAQPAKNHENAAPARAPAMISKLGGLGLGAGAGVGLELRDYSACKESLAPFVSWLEPTRLAFNKTVRLAVTNTAVSQAG